MRNNFKINTYIKLVSLMVVSAFFLECHPKKLEIDNSIYEIDLRKEWPKFEVPSNNPMTNSSVALGKRLFFDRRLSKDETVSCANCHKPEFGFADGTSLSVGVGGELGFRNSGSLTNVAYLPYFNRDGGVKSLDVFSAVPIEDHNEMNFNLVAMKKRLMKDKHYVHLAKEIYNRDIDGFVVTRALASYLRTFISDQSPYDKYVYEEDSSDFSDEAKRGMDLFFGPKAQCGSCHSGINFTNYAFENNGLYPTYAGIDRGRERITLDSLDEGRFRVASLRNIELTPPYMHDGSLASLEDVLAHYSANGSNHPNENEAIDQINLSKGEQQEIIAFLKTLTDQEFINDTKYRHKPIH